jgi:hypothetical protein
MWQEATVVCFEVVVWLEERYHLVTIRNLHENRETYEDDSISFEM